MNRIGRISVWFLAICLTAFVPSFANAFWLPPVPREGPALRPDQQLVDEDTGDAISPEAMDVSTVPVAPPQRFGLLLFGNPQSVPDTVNERLEKILRFKLDDVARECRLSEAQKKKLLLAGRGDIKRLVDEMHAEQRSFESVPPGHFDPERTRILQAAVRRLRELVNAGPFDDESIFAKVLRRDLTAEQYAVYVVTDEIQRWGGTITTVAQGGAEFKNVSAMGGTLNDERLAKLTKLPNMRVLTAELTSITDGGLASLAGLNRLEVLDLSRTRISSPGMLHLAGLRNLQVVFLRNTVVGDEGLLHLGKIASLRELHLQGTPVTDTGLAHLKWLEQLELLNVGRTRITDAGLIDLNLSNLTRLKELGLSHIKVGDRGMERIGRCANLERLILIGTPITDSTIRHLRNLKKLRYLLIDQTGITDDGLAAFADIASLENLEASNTPIGDIGLLSLRKLASLKYLNVANTQVTDDGVSEFHRALPDVVVHK